MQKLTAPFVVLYPGVIVCAILALVAQFIAENYGAPTMLMALLLGLALNFLSQEGKCAKGIDFTATTLLRVGVALLGVRISFDMIIALGPYIVLLVIISVIITIGFGLLLGVVLKTDRYFAFLTAGAVAICGASAAMAIASIIPHKNREQERLLFTVAGVTILSTIAMVIYPIISAQLGLAEDQTGIFLGATIHDVAQVVGAGYSVSDTTGDVATLVKLLRVAMLAPVILCASVILHRHTQATNTGTKPTLLPGFIIGFCCLVVINSMGWLPDTLVMVVGHISRWALVMAIAAVGIKIDLSTLRFIGKTPVVMIVSETLFIALFVVFVVLWIG